MFCCDALSTRSGSHSELGTPPERLHATRSVCGFGNSSGRQRRYFGAFVVEVVEAAEEEQERQAGSAARSSRRPTSSGSGSRRRGCMVLGVCAVGVVLCVTAVCNWRRQNGGREKLMDKGCDVAR
jgi:hypothetical protein